MYGICGSSRPVNARRMRLFACPRSPRRMKLCRERIALMICGTTVSSYPTMPGNTAPSPCCCKRATRLSRSSSFTRRVRKRSSEKLLRRRSPSERGTLMTGTPTYAARSDYTPRCRTSFGCKRHRLVHMPVPAGLLAGARNPPQLWQNPFQISGDRVNPFALRTHRQQFLLEVKIERQRSRQIKGKLILIRGRKVLHRARQRQNFQMKLDGPRFLVELGVTRLVRNQQDFSAQERPLLIQFEHFKPLSTLRDQVQPPVRIFFCHANDFRRAADVCNALLQGTNNPEGGMVRQALRHHLLVAWFKDMKRQRDAGKQHHFEGKQRKKGHAVSSRQATSDSSIVRQRSSVILTCCAVENTTRACNSTER